MYIKTDYTVECQFQACTTSEEWLLPSGNPLQINWATEQPLHVIEESILIGTLPSHTGHYSCPVCSSHNNTLNIAWSSPAVAVYKWRPRINFRDILQPPTTINESPTCTK